MSQPQFTTIVAVDAEHLREFVVAFPTWVQNVRGFDRKSLLLLFDSNMSAGEIASLHAYSDCPVHVDEILPPKFPRTYAVTQRERMLSAIAYATRRVTTKWFLKLDTDTIAMPGGDWLYEAAVKNEDASGGAVIIAPRWGYTKPGHWLDMLDLWADTVPQLRHSYRPKRTMSGNVAKSPRIISYAMFGRTDFANECLDLLADREGRRLPVPSQDTFAWYCAVAMQRDVVRVNPSGIRWRHAGGNYGKLTTLAREALS